MMMSPDSPTPHLPRGAGGPPRRAAGRVFSYRPSSQGRPHHSRTDRTGGEAVLPPPGSLHPPCDDPPQVARLALVLEPDPLARLLVEPAVEALGLLPVAGPGAAALSARDPAAVEGAGSPGATGWGSVGGPAVVFLPLAAHADCMEACAAARATGEGAPPLVVGYGAGQPALLAAHRAHRCADVVLLLTAGSGGPRFAHLPLSDPVAEAGLTEREADVLVLLLAGHTTAGIAGHLCVSLSTARSHCRAVLRKTGAGDRRALRARLLAGPDDVPCEAVAAALPQFA